ncbi:MAG: hypothetical protein ABI224_15265 [Acetobacteraceae bacterium]
MRRQENPRNRHRLAATNAEYREHLETLASRLPGWLRRAVYWLLKPSSKWLRIPLGGLLVVFGCFGFLPILGFWMVPMGALLLAEDFPVVRRPTIRAIKAIQGWWERRQGGGTSRSRP